MDSHEVISKAVEQTSFKEVAAQMGVSLSLAYKWSQPDEQQGSGTSNPLDRVRQLFEITKDPQLIQWLCHKANGVFVQNPISGGPRGMELMAVLPGIDVQRDVLQASPMRIVLPPSGDVPVVDGSIVSGKGFRLRLGGRAGAA